MSASTWHHLPGVWPDPEQLVWVRLVFGTASPFRAFFDDSTLTFAPQAFASDNNEVGAVPWFLISEWRAADVFAAPDISRFEFTPGPFATAVNWHRSQTLPLGVLGVTFRWRPEEGGDWTITSDYSDDSSTFGTTVTPGASVEVQVVWERFGALMSGWSASATAVTAS